MPRRAKDDSSRAAVMKFLREEVGVGGTFRASDLRRVIPDVEQVGRRMRDLRAAIPTPWVIASSQSDRTLPTGVYRLDRIGDETIPKPVSGRLRREVFEAAGNRCQVCGIGAGEEFAEYPGELARLQIGHWVPLDQGGSSARGNLRSECNRCNGGIRNQTGALVTAASIRARMHTLRRKNQDELLAWLEQERRDVGDAERLFYEIRQLPPDEQQTLVQELRLKVQGARPG